MASVYVASYLAYSLPALAAGIAVTRYGLHDTADVYGVALIALALLALGLAHRLQDPESPAGRRERDEQLALLDTPAPIPGHASRVPERIQ